MRGWLWLGVVAACGRLGFDGRTAGTGGGGGGGGGDTGPDANAAVAQPTTDGLVAYWTFDDVVDGNLPAVDASGNAHDAPCRDSGACPTTTAGAKGNAAQFDGKAECLTVPTLTTWDDPQLTVSAWVNTAGPDGSIFTHESSNGCPSPELRLGSGAVGLVQLNTSDSTHNNAFTPDAVMTPAQWHHVAVTWDGTRQAVYVDGACNCAVAPQLQPLDNPMEVTIGCYPNAAEVFGGAIDELRVYNRALAPAEIGTLSSYVTGEPVVVSPCDAACSTVAPM